MAIAFFRFPSLRKTKRVTVIKGQANNLLLRGAWTKTLPVLLMMSTAPDESTQDVLNLQKYMWDIKKHKWEGTQILGGGIKYGMSVAWPKDGARKLGCVEDMLELVRLYGSPSGDIVEKWVKEILKTIPEFGTWGASGGRISFQGLPKGYVPPTLGRRGSAKLFPDRADPEFASTVPRIGKARVVNHDLVIETPEERARREALLSPFRVRKQDPYVPRPKELYVPLHFGGTVEAPSLTPSLTTEVLKPEPETEVQIPWTPATPDATPRQRANEELESIRNVEKMLTPPATPPPAPHTLTLPITPPAGPQKIIRYHLARELPVDVQKRLDQAREEDLQRLQEQGYEPPPPEPRPLRLREHPSNAPLACTDKVVIQCASDAPTPTPTRRQLRILHHEVDMPLDENGNHPRDPNAPPRIRKMISGNVPPPNPSVYMGDKPWVKPEPIVQPPTESDIARRRRAWRVENIRREHMGLPPLPESVVTAPLIRHHTVDKPLAPEKVKPGDEEEGGVQREVEGERAVRGEQQRQTHFKAIVRPGERSEEEPRGPQLPKPTRPLVRYHEVDSEPLKPIKNVFIRKHFVDRDGIGLIRRHYCNV